jgi:hypothetical protein
MSPLLLISARLLAARALPMRADSPPLDPDANTAREQLLNELSKPEYQAASKSLLDYVTDWINSVVKAIEEWIAALLGNGGPGAVDLTGPVILIGIVIVAVIAFLLFGLPRINRRSRSVGSLFGDDDERDSQTLRRAAERAAASGDFSTAIAEGFRSIARGLAERTVVTTFPGTTAHGFAERAAASFPDSVVELRAAADSFDGVRYLGAVGTEPEWLRIAALERQLRAARPRLEAVPA